MGDKKTYYVAHGNAKIKIGDVEYSGNKPISDEHLAKIGKDLLETWLKDKFIQKIEFDGGNKPTDKPAENEGNKPETVVGKK